MPAKASQENHASWKIWVRQRDQRYFTNQTTLKFSLDPESTNVGRLITCNLPLGDHSTFFGHITQKMLLARYYPLEGESSDHEHGALIVNNECYSQGLALVSHTNAQTIFQKAGKIYSPQQGLECMQVIGLPTSSFLSRFFNTHHHVMVRKPHFWSEGRVVFYARSEDERKLRSVSYIKQVPFPSLERIAHPSP